MTKNFIPYGGNYFLEKAYNVSTLSSMYGIGKVHARKLNQIFGFKNDAINFGENFVDFIDKPRIRDIISTIILGAKVREYAFNKWKDKIKARIYPAYRLFQNLPTKGQRTRANGNTPKHYNPFLKLNVNNIYYEQQKPLFKEKELFLNDRAEELKQHKKDQVDRKKNRKKDLKEQLKKRREQFIRANKEHFKEIKAIVKKKGRTLSKKMGRKDKK